MLSCAICINQDHPLQLARLLEKVLASMFLNKLSTPFLCPLLPLPDLEDCAVSVSAAGRGVDPSYDTADLFSVLHKVRRLEYQTFEQFRSDLGKVRENIVVVLSNIYLKKNVDPDVSGSSSSENILVNYSPEYESKKDAWVKNHCLLQSFDSVCDAAVNLSSEKQKILTELSMRATGAALSLSFPNTLRLWRRECSAGLPAPFTGLHRVTARSEELWCKQMELAVVVESQQPQVVVG